MAGYKARLKRSWKFFVAIIAPLVLLPVLFISSGDDTDKEANSSEERAEYPEGDESISESRKFKLAYVILVMAVYWALEIIPLPITSLFPLVMFPLFGIDDAASVSKSYMKESNTIFLGGAIVALAVEYCNLHRRVALRLITIVGVSPKRLMFGIMVVTSFLSMWISNTTTVTMIVPIIVAIVDEIHEVSDATIAEFTFPQQDQTEDGNNNMTQHHYRPSSVFANAGLSSHHNRDPPQNDDNHLSSLGVLEGHRANKRDSHHSHQSHQSDHLQVHELNNAQHPQNNQRPLQPLRLSIIKAEHASERNSINSSESIPNRLYPNANGRESVTSKDINFRRSRGTSMASVIEPGRLETMIDLPSPTPSEEMDEIKRMQTIEKEKWRRIKNMYLFALAYAANIGGTATITGTGPNKVFKEVLKPYADDISQDGKYLGMTFFTWMALNVPPMVVNVIIAWIYLVIKYCGLPKFSKKPVDEAEHALERWKEQNVKHYLIEEYKRLGKMTFHEIGVALIFLLVVFLWILRDPQIFQGWKEITSDSKSGDSTSALLGAVLLFIIPKSWSFLTSKDGASFETLLDWKFVTQKLPWGVLLLLGSGYAIGDSADRTGLSSFIGKELYLLHDLPEPLLLFIIMFFTTIITEVVSNTAVASVLLPVLLGLSREMGTHPLYYSVGAAVTASYAFMLPVASPVNAIVFAAGDFSIWEMIGNGYILNGICVLIFYFNTLTLGEAMFDYKDFTYPPPSTSAEHNVTDLF